MLDATALESIGFIFRLSSINELYCTVKLMIVIFFVPLEDVKMYDV